jgi:transcriptional regulator with XRE-family HTH domain
VPLPPSSSSAWQARQALAARLGEIRKDAGLTGRALAALCGWHEAKVSRIEHARTAPSADDIRAWCQHCAAPDETDEMRAFLRSVEDMFVEWRRMERAGLKRAQEAVLPLWQRTRIFRAYSSWLIPGAVQTPAYTKAILRAIAARRDLPDDTDEAAAVRADRLRLLREGDHRFFVVVEESVLRNVIGGADVMAGQLGHLITVASLPSVSLGIIPMGLERDAIWPVEDFWVFDDRQVNVELVSGWLTLTQPREIATYAKTFSDLSDLAVRGAQARALITAAIDALGG